MTPMCEILLWSVEAPERSGDTALVVNPSPEDAAELAGHFGAGARFWFSNFERFRSTLALRPELTERAEFGVSPTAIASGYDRVVVYHERSKPRMRLLLSISAGAAGASSSLYLVGRNNEGIKSAKSTLRSAFGEVEKVQAARHCAVFVARGPAPGLADLEHAAARHRLDPPAATGEYVAAPGVFAKGLLDDGSRLLLENIRPSRADRVLDVGCGVGVLGLGIASRMGTESATLVDVDAYALWSARRNAALVDGVDVTVAPSDVLSDVSGRFDLIVSNPPFHDGAATSSRFIQTLAGAAGRHLGRKGEVWIVANRFLKYEPLLGDAFRHVDVMADDGRYRVFRAK